jgi:hypothetical protein
MSAQEVLDKLEFFPIKCRIQRAADSFQRCMAEREVSGNCRELKKKVHYVPYKWLKLLNSS